MTATLPPTLPPAPDQTPNHGPDRRLGGGAVPGANPGGPSGSRLTALGHRAALLGLSPVLLGQGLWTRIKTPVLPEPPGARSGSVGQGRRLRLLIAGDSAAAGVGVDHQSQALSGQIAALMAPICRLDWRLLAQRGWRSRDLIAQLRGLGDDRFDVALLSLGVNDVTGGVGRAAFLRAQQDLANLLADRFGIRHILVTAVPPMGVMTALPQPLRAVLGQRARHFNTGLMQQVAADPRRHLISPEIGFHADVIARDGFHPNRRAYHQWAQYAVSLMRPILQTGDCE